MRRDSGRCGPRRPRRAVRWAAGPGRAGLTRDGSKSCSICRSFLLFSSSRRRSFVFIRSTSLFCMRNDWRKKGQMHPAHAARTRTAGNAPSHTHTHCGGLQATRTCTARDTGLGDAPGRLVHQGAGRGGGRGLGGRAALGGGPSEGPLGAGPPTQRGTPCPARSAADGHWGQCCCWAPGHVTSAATREASVVTAPITQTCQTLTSIYNPRPRPRPAGRGNGSQVFACESTSHQPAVSGDLSSRCAALSLPTVCSCPVPRNVCLLLWTEPSCDMAMGGRLHFQRPRSINLLPSL